MYISALRQAQQALGDHAAAAQSFATSADIHMESKNYFEAENTYKALAQAHLANGTLEQYEQETQELLKASLRDKDQTKELAARLALGAVQRARGNDVEALEQYATSYDLQQGKVDYDAVRVEQHEVGFSDQKIGTDNIQQCVAVILYDPITKKTALAHVDKFTDTSSLADVIASFPKGTKLNAYLVGGRDRSPQSKAVSDNNIARVMGELQKHQTVDVKSADIGDKGAPSGIVFDPQTGELKHAVPGKQHETTNTRKLLLHASNPPLRFAFDLTQSQDMPSPILTDADKKSLINRYLSTPKTQNAQETWNANIVYEPLAKVAEQIRQENPKIVQEALTEYVDHMLKQNPSLNKQTRQQCRNELLSSTEKALSDPTKSFVQIEQDLNKGIASKIPTNIQQSTQQMQKTAAIIEIISSQFAKISQSFKDGITTIKNIAIKIGQNFKDGITTITKYLSQTNKSPQATIVTQKTEQPIATTTEQKHEDLSIRHSVDQFRSHHTSDTTKVNDLPAPLKHSPNTEITK